MPDRKLPRLSGFDYASQNYYFVTICTNNRKHLFGAVGRLNEFGKLVEKELLDIPSHFRSVRIDRYVIMPNHIHAIIVIGCCGENAERSRPFPTLSTVVGLFKSGVSRQIRLYQPGAVVWQKSFYDRIIRNETGYYETIKYIEENPLKWELDEYYSNER